MLIIFIHNNDLSSCKSNVSTNTNNIAAINDGLTSLFDRRVYNVNYSVNANSNITIEIALSTDYNIYYPISVMQIDSSNTNDPAITGWYYGNQYIYVELYNQYSTTISKSLNVIIISAKFKYINMNY